MEGNEWEEMSDNTNFKVYENQNLDFQSLEYKRIKVEKFSNAYLNYHSVFHLLKDSTRRVVKSYSKRANPRYENMMNLHKQLHDKHYNHLLPHFPSLSLISLKAEMSEEQLQEIKLKVELYFHKLLGYQFIEKDEDFMAFWDSSVSDRESNGS